MVDASDDSFLLVLPLPIFHVGDALYLDAQACNGLNLWLRFFSRMTLALPMRRVEAPPRGTIALRDAVPGDGLTVIGLPFTPRPLAFARSFFATRALLGGLIERHRYLQFAIGGLWGDWGAVGALAAAEGGRKASVWTDRVESEVMRIDAGRRRGARRLVRGTWAAMAKRLEAQVIRRTALGLFHGRDTFTAYAPFSPNPHLVHDIHLSARDRIGPDDLRAKIAAVGHGPLRIIYLGRAHPDKGPLDWVEALRLVAERGVAFEAVWHGDGPELESARAAVRAHGLDGMISFPGPSTDRAFLLRQLRRAHIFAFCHKTPESPRCLIEALLSGTPIVGYRSAYAEDLIAGHGGGDLGVGDPAALAARIVALDADRARLARLMEAAAADGHPLVDEDVFAHRSALIRRYT